MLSILAVVVVILGLIALHELGHLLIAKANGMTVPAFSIGFGPVLWRKRFRGTEYRLSLIPLGGYVEIPQESGNPTDDKQATDKLKAQGHPAEVLDTSRWYSSKNGWQQISVLAAGPVANLIVAAVLTTVVFLFWGLPLPTEALKIETIMPSAHHSGLQIGDRVVTVNGQAVGSADEFYSEFFKSGQAASRLGVVRGSDTLSVTVSPVSIEGNLYPPIDFKSAWMKMKPAQAIAAGVFSTGRMVSLNVSAIGGLVHGRGTENASSVVGVSKVGNDAAKRGLPFLLLFAAAVSIGLGVFNLLPVPGLDGGQMIWALYKLFSGREISRKIKEPATRFAFVLIIIFAVFLVGRDIMMLAS